MYTHKKDKTQNAKQIHTPTKLVGRGATNTQKAKHKTKTKRNTNKN